MELSSLFIGAFSILQHEDDKLPDATRQPTSIRLNRDAKTAMCSAAEETIGEKPLWQPCFLHKDTIYAKRCQGVRGGSAVECNGLGES